MMWRLIIIDNDLYINIINYVSTHRNEKTLCGRWIFQKIYGEKEKERDFLYWHKYFTKWCYVMGVGMLILLLLYLFRLNYIDWVKAWINREREN